MKFVICWLISVADTLGVFSSLYMLFALGRRPGEDLGVFAAYLPNDFHYAWAGAVFAILPAIATAIYGTMNYDLTLSRGIIRWTSPLNYFENSVVYFFKSLILTGAVWAALITFFLFKCFPNYNFAWTLDMVKSFVHIFI